MRTIRRILPLALLAVLAAACATLRVDVDVYTGPLADHEDIQAERMAVMAIGAKPLLIELRDRLENKGREEHWDKRPAAAANAVREIGPNWGQYVPGYIQPSSGSTEYDAWNTLIDPKARRVNAVLGLYEDKQDPELASYIADARSAFAEYRASRETLQSAAAARMHDALLGLAAASTGEKKALALAYASFFQDDLCVYDLARMLNPAEPGCGASSAERQGLPSERSTLYFLHIASDRAGFVTSHAKVLFKDNPADRENFPTQVKERAAAFLAKRRAMERLFTLSLVFIRDITQEPLQSKIRNLEELVSLASGLAASILRASYLPSLKACCESPATSCPDCKAIQGITGKLAPTDTYRQAKPIVEGLLATHPHDTAVQLLAAHDMVKRGYCINPDPVATQFGATLFKEDEEFPTPEQLLAALNRMDSLVAATGMERGRGPWGLERLIEDYLNATQDFTALGCGKTDAEHPSENCAGPAADLRKKRDILREELVRFAEKVLVIANHEVLLTQYAENSSEPSAKIVENIQVLQAVANSLLSQANELRFRQEHREVLADHLPGLASALAETYAPDGRRTLALVVSQLAAERAAATASLAQPDTAAEDKAKAQAKAAELDTAIAVIEAIRATWQEPTDPKTNGSKPESPQEVVSRLHATLRAKPGKEYETTARVVASRAFSFPALGAPTPKAKDLDDPRLALDQLLDALRLAQAREVQAGGAGSPAAVRAAQAIEVVEAQRAGLIYLRPASAYLRSSYTATSLQPGLDAKWRNTLARNFFRSVPLLGEVRSTDEMRRLRVFAEIDRQSWQTVNTVRLEGVGRTNYAIAKDDIGNWYAKAYSADPKEIIKGAKSLAMFSLGMPAGVVSEAAKKAQESGAKPATPQQTALERLRSRYAAQYEERTKQQAGDLGKWLGDDTAATQIRDVWAKDTAVAPFQDDLGKALDAASAEVKLADPAAALLKANKETYGPRIQDGLKALKRFALVLDARLAVQALSNPDETRTAEAFATAKKQARDAARRMLRSKLDTALAERQATVDEYFTALAFLGDALSEDPAAGTNAQ
jgi:hypothetical protein